MRLGWAWPGPGAVRAGHAPGTPTLFSGVTVYDERVPVLIIGGGLAGLSAAVFLGLHGVPPMLVEKHPTTSLQPKARGQYPHTMEVLRIAGVDDEIRAASPGGTGDFYMAVAETLTGTVTLDINTAGQMTMDHVSPEAWAMASQERTEAILVKRAAELGARVCFSTELLSFTQDADGVTAVVRDTETGTRRTVRADYLVGADGWRSPVRAILGVGTHSRGTLGYLVRVFFDADMHDVLRHVDGAADARKFALWHLTKPVPSIFYNNDQPGRYGFIGSLTPEPVNPETLPEGWFADLVRTGLGLPDLDLTVVEVGETPLLAYVADTFTRGRVHLIGDAARVVPAPGGLGGNTAVMDGFYLAWKLAAVVRGLAGPGLLDSHDAERRPVSDMIAEQQFINTVVRMAPELADGNDDIAALIDPVTQVFGYRCAHGAVAREPGDEAELLEDPTMPTGRPGSRAPYVPLERDGRPSSTTELFGAGFVLLTSTNADSRSTWEHAARSAFARLGVDVAVHGIAGPSAGVVDPRGAAGLIDPAGMWEKAYGITATGAVLVRPDRFIGWRAAADPGGDGPAADALEAALRTVLDRPHTREPGDARVRVDAHGIETKGR